MKVRYLAALTVATLFIFAGGRAWSQETKDDAWQFDIAPFVWLVNLDGDMTAKNIFVWVGLR